MRRSTGSRNPMITGGSNMLSTTSGSSAKRPSSYKSMMSKLSGMAMQHQQHALSEGRLAESQNQPLLDYNDFGHIWDGATERFDARQSVQGADPAQASQQMSARDFQLTPGGQQMGRFQQLAAIRANPGQSGYAQMMQQAGGQTQQPQGMYPGSMAANEHNQNALAGYQERGGMGMNIKQGADGRYALTSAANTGPRSQTANPLTRNKMMVDAQGIEASLGNTEDPKYQIDASTLPAYREGAARQQQRIKNAKEANGGLSSRDATKLSKIEQMVASGRTTKPQAAAQLRKMQGRHGLVNNDRIKTVIDRMEGKKKSKGTVTTESQAFLNDEGIKEKYTLEEKSAAKDQLSELVQKSAVAKELSVTESTTLYDDIFSLGSSIEDLAIGDLQDFAAVFERKVAASGDDYTTKNPDHFALMQRLTNAVDKGDERGIQKSKEELKTFIASRKKQMKRAYEGINMWEP